VDGGAPPDLSARREGVPSELRDAEWARLAQLIPPASPGGRPRKTDMRAAMNAILHLLRTGCPWLYLPREGFPPSSTVYNMFRKFQRAGTWEAIWAELHMALRERIGREASPSAAILDRHSVKSAEKRAAKMTSIARFRAGRRPCGYVKDHVKPLACGGPTRSRTSNGRRPLRRRLRIAGSGRAALASRVPPRAGYKRAPGLTRVWQLFRRRQPQLHRHLKISEVYGGRSASWSFLPTFSREACRNEERGVALPRWRCDTRRDRAKQHAQGMSIHAFHHDLPVPSGCEPPVPRRMRHSRRFC
jgi:putative transposase